MGTLPRMRPGPLAERTALLFRETPPANRPEARIVANWSGPLEPKSLVADHLTAATERVRTLAARSEGAEKAALEQAEKNLAEARKLLLGE
jgi:hypothetical protein